jgi:hypothetical protein
MTERAIEGVEALDTFRQAAELSTSELWLRYFELGGLSTGLEMEGYLFGLLVPTARDHDMIALAINERLVELGRDHEVPYLADPGR